MWMGFAEDHKSGTYCLYNPATRKVILSQDVTFLRKHLKDYEAERLINTRRTFKRQVSSKFEVDKDDDDNDVPHLVSEDGEESDDDLEESELDDPDSVGSNPENENAVGDISSRVSKNLPGILRDSSVPLTERQIKALRNLKASFLNPEATRLLDCTKLPSTENTEKTSQSPNTSDNSGTTES